MEVFTNTLEMQYQMSAADAAKVRKIARSLPPGRAERVQVDGVGVGPATNTLEITNDRVTSWSNWVGVDPRVPAEAGGWHTVQSRNLTTPFVPTDQP